MGDNQLIGNRFEIGSLIGQGGMGDVYRGKDTFTGEMVAIKSLKSEVLVNDPGLVERFEREGEALSRLNHPNIIKMLASIHENDRHYLVMEHVSGGSLRELLEETPQLPIERVLNMALDLADALTRAHRLQIIHRDIKPANVLLAEDGTPRLGDFGVAHMGDRTRVTESGSIIGTYAYMSPEGCMGEDLDARADIWSFGIMLYEMLAGRRPFEGTQPATVLTAILSKPVPDVLQFRPDAPAPLLGLIYSMLEKKRDNRISSVRLVGAQLEAFIKGSDTSIQRMTNLFSDGDPGTTPGSGIHVVQPTDGPTLEITPPGGIELIPRLTSTSRSSTVAPPKKVVGAPRIFISYRREDSIAVTGRIYDRLVDAFGEAYVFKDVDKIPVGANFKTILENEVASCDVLLVIIGENWLDVRDPDNHPRLQDPNDFVRIEVKAALDRQDILVIPVLVNNASMPGVDNLPPTLTDLAFHNAALVRNDPDFNRDVGWLIEQIQRDFEITPPPQKRSWLKLAAAALVGLLIVALGLWLLLPALQSDTPVTRATVNVTSIPPVAADEYMVLLADIEHVGGQERGITQLLADDLYQQLETTPFSNLRVRRYAAVIHSDAEARTIADSAGAAVIVWGNYDDSGVTVKVQMGSLAVFPPTQFSGTDIENVTNVRLQMTDPRRESTAPAVLAIMGMLHTVSANIFELGRNKAIYDSLDAPHATVLDTGTAAQYQEYFAAYSDDPTRAQEIINQAIADNSSNPLPYISRALIRQSTGQFTQALQDTRTASLLGPKGWLAPTYLYALNHLIFQPNYPQGITELDQIISQHPEDWYAYGLRAMAYYFTADYETARTDFAESNAHNPQANYFYPYAISVALRQGRLADAKALIEEVMTKFPDPEATRRILDAGYGSAGTQTAFGPAFSAFGNMLLQQWDQALVNANAALAINPDYIEVYLFKGIVDCNLGNYSDAEADYTRLLELDPTFLLVHGLRAEVLLKQNKLPDAILDVRTFLDSDQGEIYQPLVPLIQSGKLSCENFLTFDFASIEDVTPVPPVPTSLPTATVAPTLVPTVESGVIVPPVADDEYMVLVAQLEPLGAVRDVNRFIIRDLTSKLEQDIPFSKIRIRSLPHIITTDEEAQQAAEVADASVIIWGNYTPDLIELEVQVGSLAKFPKTAFDRQQLEQTANVTVRMTNERSQSVITSVLGVLSVLQAADGNGYQMMRLLAILDQINVTPLEVEGNGLSAHVHRSIQSYINDTAASIDEMTAGVAIDPGNPIIYIWRSGGRQRLAQYDEALQDIRSAARRGPQGWVLPLYLRGNVNYLQNDLDGAVTTYSQIIEQRPDDWFPYNMRGWIYYLKGEYDLAKADYALAFDLKPDTNFPYIISALIAMREGRMSDARGYLDTILRQFPDPTFANRLIRAAFGEQADKDVVGPMFSAVGDFTLEQYDQMLVDTQKALVLAPYLSDLHALEGFAYCNLGEYVEAEEAYNKAVEMAPDVPIVYVLRADSRLKQLNVLGANEDSTKARELIQSSGQGEELNAYLDYGLRGQVGCDNFLEWQPPG